MNLIIFYFALGLCVTHQIQIKNYSSTNFLAREVQKLMQSTLEFDLSVESIIDCKFLNCYEQEKQARNVLVTLLAKLVKLFWLTSG